jgi:hypothetical protein
MLLIKLYVIIRAWLNKNCHSGLPMPCTPVRVPVRNLHAGAKGDRHAEDKIANFAYCAYICTLYCYQNYQDFVCSTITTYLFHCFVGVACK